MKRIIFTVLALMLFGGVASADRRWRDTSQHSGGTVVRDHRHHDRSDYRRDYRSDYRRNDGDRYRNRVRYSRQPVYVNNGRFVFHGGVVRHYQRPVIKYRYYDYRVRPSIIVENYDPVPGYIWMQGSWSWNGYEWVWTNGYYAPDPNYVDNTYYDNTYYDNTTYYDHSTHDHNCDHDYNY